MAEPIRRLKVCLNGGRARSEHPAVPITVAELAASARAAIEAGAEAIHLHPRAPDGRESLRSADIGAAVAAVRRSCPGVPIGVSTGLWMTGGNVSARLSSVSGWVELAPAQRPDFASVNLSEPDFVEVVGVLAEAGIGAEAGVWSVPDTVALAAAAPELVWLRILVEILTVAADRAVDEADRVLNGIKAAGLDVPVLLHGEGESCWPLVRHAGKLGLASRIGLEDVMSGPDGRQVRSNAELVTLAVQEWGSAAVTGR
jgi:uncharacterized protein (DUF849 family)